MAAVADEHFSSLQLLLKAPSKDAVRELCAQSFPPAATESQQLAEKTAEILNISTTEAKQVVVALHSLSHCVVLSNMKTVDQVLSLFPDSFHSNLKTLITKIILEHSVTWRNEALNNQISLPQLKQLDWRVDMMTASDSISRMAVPSCLLQLQIEEASCLGGGESSVTVELSRESLDTMLDGLGRIRDQLSAVAAK